ncbi:hypothetical protein [Glycomyces tritici]|uniref:Uncharacterized protein n=1 Tax=Glycomyces tritici TaxID=2665176 RepID=A0ABT7YS66_9ACTN|nr:hypothetical protein [Glycomyces tritici]MDN3241475.1 hypothetical protein [Glycomyces tritici]MDN3242262.1 hypothetical protein [Glycomyces tritici]
MAPAPATAALQDRYPLPEWVVDSKFKRELTQAVADAIAAETDRWPSHEGPSALREHAEHVTMAARTALEPLLAWLQDCDTDGYSYPGDILVSYIAQLALTRPGETLEPGRYRELLRAYRQHLALQARRYVA